MYVSIRHHFGDPSKWAPSQHLPDVKCDVKMGGSKKKNSVNHRRLPPLPTRVIYSAVAKKKKKQPKQRYVHTRLCECQPVFMTQCFATEQMKKTEIKRRKSHRRGILPSNDLRHPSQLIQEVFETRVRDRTGKKRGVPNGHVSPVSRDQGG